MSKIIVLFLIIFGVLLGFILLRTEMLLRRWSLKVRGEVK